MEQVGIGIIGTGRISRSHLRSLQGFDRAKVVAVTDVIRERAETVASEFNIPHVCESTKELVSREDIQAVIVCTPPYAHAEPTLMALQAGKHVLCEKPFALDVQEAVQMTETAEAVGRHLAVCSSRSRCGAAARKAKELAEKGELGTIYHIRSSFFRQRGRPGLDFWPDATWFLNKDLAGGGVLMDLGVYQLDLILWLMGNPRVESVLATAYKGIGPSAPNGVRHDVEEHIVVMLRFEGGRSAIMENAWASNIASANTFLVFGDKAGLRFNPLTLIREPLVEGKLTEEPVLNVSDQDTSGFGNVTTAFVNALVEGWEPWSPAREALQVCRVMEAAYRSIEEGQSVALV